MQQLEVLSVRQKRCMHCSHSFYCSTPQTQPEQQLSTPSAHLLFTPSLCGTCPAVSTSKNSWLSPAARLTRMHTPAHLQQQQRQPHRPAPCRWHPRCCCRAAPLQPRSAPCCRYCWVCHQSPSKAGCAAAAGLPAALLRPAPPAAGRKILGVWAWRWQQSGEEGCRRGGGNSQAWGCGAGSFK